jgi:hypothetical protein
MNGTRFSLAISSLVVTIVFLSRWIIQGGLNSQKDAIEIIANLITIGIVVPPLIKWVIQRESESDQKRLQKDEGVIKDNLQVLAQATLKFQELLAAPPNSAAVSNSIELQELRNQISSIQEVFVDKQRLYASKEAIDCLGSKDLRISLTKDAVNAALIKHPLNNLPSGSLNENRALFSKKIYTYLTWIWRSLRATEDISRKELLNIPRLPTREPYIAALKSIEKKLPKYMSPAAVDEVKFYLKILTKELP